MNARYVPGESVAAVTGGSVVMAAPDRVAEVSALAGARRTPLEVLSGLSGGDVARLPAFAAAVLDGTDLVLMVRGPYTVRCGDGEWSGSEVATWREHRVPAGETVVIDDGGASRGPELPIVTGAVLASRVAWQPETDAEKAPAQVEEHVPVGAPTPQPVAAPAAPAPEADPEADPDRTLAGPEGGFDETVGATIHGRRTPDPVRGDHDGRTISAERLRELRAQEAPDTLTERQVTASLSISGGETLDLTKPVIIGRSPRADHKSGASLPRLVVVDDPYVSGTHLEVAVDGGVVLATDRSTNGTLITRPGEQPQPLVTGEPTAVDDGCVLSLSDDLTVTVSVGDVAG